MVTAAGRLIGAPIKRVEDPRFITGGARYVADIRLPGTLSVAFLRSPYASARIRRLDISRARALPGVVAVLTGEDVAGLGEMPVNRVVAGMRVPPHPLLVRDRVRTVGEPVAAVVAETPALARDALELIDAEYEAGSAVVDPEEALKPGAPLVHPEFGTNVAYTFGQEGSMIGLMWGNNALFGAISPLILGLLAQSFGLGVVFWYALVLYLAGALLTVTL